MTAAPADRDAPIRQASLRSHNLGLALRHVAASATPLSRAEIAAATGLTKATVSALVEELLTGGLLAEVGASGPAEDDPGRLVPRPRAAGGPGPNARAGRPGVGLWLAPDGPAGLGVEIGTDALTACLVDLSGSVRHAGHRGGGQRGREPGAVLDDVAALIREAGQAARGPVAGVAIAVPGLVADGVVLRSAGLDWSDVDVRTGLRERLPAGSGAVVRPDATVENAGTLAALGELHAWPDTEAPSFLYIGGQAEIAAGIVLNGQLHRGPRGHAGELAHVTIRPDGAYCRCGARGCLDAHAGPAIILANAGLIPPDAPPDAGGAALGRLVALARAGAHPALMALEEAGAALGVAAATAANLLDLDTVVLGGAFAALAPWLAGPIEREITDRVPAAAWAPVTVRTSSAGASATVLGAAGSVVWAIRDSPATWLAA